MGFSGFMIESDEGGSVRKIGDRTYYFDLGTLACTGYAVDEERIILIDCGIGYTDTDILIKLLQSMNMSAAAVIASHCHIDHVGGIKKLYAQYGTKLYIPELEADVLRSYSVLKSNFPFASMNMVKKCFGNMHWNPDFTFPFENHTLNVEGADFRVIPAPGHSIASCCFITEDNVMHLGDTLITRDEMEHSSLLYTFLIDEDIKSKEMLRDYDCSAYVAVHKGCFDNITALIDENVTYMKGMAERFALLLDCPRSMEDIIRAYNDKYGLGGKHLINCALIERNVRPYIEYLFDQGRLICETDRCVVKYKLK